MKKQLGQTFFNRETLRVAKELLGKYLVWTHKGKEFSLMICEVEAYDGPDDLASHASRGKTERTQIMFGHPGHFYIYLIYGMYWMLNVVVGSKDYPAAILFRGAGEICGPGRLTKYIKIDKSLHGKLACKKNELWFEDRGVEVKENQIIKTPRIGVNYAGSIWSKKPYRFLL
jgi:DNA-3-methyladenine glycosylase